MADRSVQGLFRGNPELLEELRNYFNPKPEIVKALPNPKGVDNFKTVNIKQDDNSYVEYKMLNGSWVKANGTAVADGTYTIYNDGTTSGQVTNLVIKNGIITSIGRIP